jgi:hypothetical protein
MQQVVVARKCVCVCSFLEGSERNAIVLLTDVCVAGNQSGDAWLQSDYGHRPSKFCGAASCTNRGSSNQFYPTQVHLHRTCMRQQMNYWYISSSCLLSIAFCWTWLRIQSIPFKNSTRTRKPSRFTFTNIKTRNGNDLFLFFILLTR